MLLSSSLNECRSPGLTAATLVLTRSRLVAFVQDDRSQWRVLFVFPLAAITMLAIGLGRQLFRFGRRDAMNSPPFIPFTQELLICSDSCPFLLKTC
eukprot:m.867783 g.867783  ORF g.867783 m.867783 type:complete len:96 (-) comp59730_c0_seq19:24-311(-)